MIQHLPAVLIIVGPACRLGLLRNVCRGRRRHGDQLRATRGPEAMNALVKTAPQGSIAPHRRGAAKLHRRSAVICGI